MEIVRVFWANNERMVVTFRQDVDTLQELGASTRLVHKLASIDAKGKNWVTLPRKRGDRRSEFAKINDNFSTARVFSLLSFDPKNILITYDDDSNGVADVFKVNVKTGASKRIARGSNKLQISGIDRTGEVRLAETFDENETAIIYKARRKGESEWLEVGRRLADEGSSRLFDTLGFYNPKDPNELYVISNHETDTAAIYTYDLNTMKLGEIQFQHKKYDADGAVQVLDKDGYAHLVGFSYQDKAEKHYYLDDNEKALRAQIDKALPKRLNRIVSRSRDQKTFVISSVGPRYPLAYYLLRDGQLTLLGSSRPGLKPEMLSDTKWVRYKARDGLSIPALVTIPDGEGPFPIVVNPHGGPVARDTWGYDNWAQMLAHHGYLVIQPQFRISEGFGRKHLEAGFARWGYEMQDDLEDAITFLADKKLGDPKRAAIFGWSYGGYAAFVGSLRDPNPFKCSIAGAGVADVPYFRAELADGGEFLEKAYRNTVDGLNPLDMVDSVDIPILVIHGDIDERVPVNESHKFVKKLKEFNKPHKYVELEGANHFFGTIFYRHYMKMFPEMIDWLDNRCNLKAS